MALSFEFVVDRVVRGKIYPHLTGWNAEPYTQQWREFGQHWPYTTPLRIQEYCELNQVVVNTYSIHDQYPDTAFYPVAIGFFDFSVDWFALLPGVIKESVTKGRLKILFLYHEGDNPQRIKHRLDHLATNHSMPANCYVFVSSNSAADQLDRFVAFQDSELWYHSRNRHNSALPIHTSNRQRDFTALVRTHKWWRATVMADLHRAGLLTNSYWSYCEKASGEDTDCPIEIDYIPNLRSARTKFLASAPYYSDNLTQEQRNDHSINTEIKYFQDAWCNIVLETLFDYDQSDGVLISEKTFKPIKHGQMFFVVGARGSLQVLRDLGYRTFDCVLDNSYDLEYDHTARWVKLRTAIAKAYRQGLCQLFEKCRYDITHNQQLFAKQKTQRLNILIEQIHAKSN